MEAKAGPPIRGLSEPQKTAVKASVVSEFNNYQQDPSGTRLRTWSEIATEAGVSKSYIQKIFLLDESLQPILAQRAKIINSQRSPDGGRSAQEQGAGIFGRTPQQRQEDNKKGGETAREKGAGIHALTPEERSATSRKVGQLTVQSRTGIHGRTAEEMSAHGKVGGEKTRREGLGIFGRTAEEISNHGKKVGQLTYQRGVGIHGRSSEQMRKDAVIASEAFSANKIVWGEQYYDSYDEAVAATSLEHYIPGFTIVRGQTYQIAEGMPPKIDFMVNGVFVEYNPIVLSAGRGSFDTIDEYQQFRLVYTSLEGEEKTQFADKTRRELRDCYYNRRRKSLDVNPKYKDHELIVATTPEELYDSVLTRFGQNLPSREEFRREFSSTTRQVKEYNKIAKPSKSSILA